MVSGPGSWQWAPPLLFVKSCWKGQRVASVASMRRRRSESNRSKGLKGNIYSKSFIKRKASSSTISRRGVLIVDNGSKYNRKQENNNIRTVGIRRFAFKPLLSLVHSSPVRNRKFHFKPYALATSTGYAGRRPLPWLAYNVARAWRFDIFL